MNCFVMSPFYANFAPWKLENHYNTMTIKSIFRSFVAALLMAGMTACSNHEFRVEGTITDAKDSVLYLEHMSLNGPEVVDSVVLGDDGKFAFSSVVEHYTDSVVAPDFFRLRIANGIINLSIDSTETVSFAASYPTMSTKYEVKGSDNCTKIKELALLQQQLLAQVLALSDDNSIGTKQTTDSIEALVEAYKDNVRKNYIFKAPHKAYSYFALFQALGNRLIFNPRESEMDIRTFAAVATGWDTFYPGTQRGENLHNIALEGLKAMRLQQARQMGPAIDPSMVQVTNIIDIPLIDNKGRQRSLTELNGKVVLLDFHAFALNDSPQRIMMLRELYNKYHSRGFEIYQVGLDANEHFWKTKTEALPWINVHDPDGMQSQYLMRYNVQSVPTFFLIDKSNSLYKRDAQMKDIEAEIESLL